MCRVSSKKDLDVIQGCRSSLFPLLQVGTGLEGVGLCLVGPAGLPCSPRVQCPAAVAGGSHAGDTRPSFPDSSCSRSSCQSGGLGSVGGLCSVGLMVGLDLKSLFQPK